MRHPIYAFGYTGRQLVQLVEAVEAADAVLLDIRYSPRSRVATWNRRRLEEALGARYQWAGDTLGNVRYREGGIQLAKPEEGFRLVEELAAQGPVALMCVCASQVGCHRSFIAEELRSRRIHVLEGLPGMTLQLPL